LNLVQKEANATDIDQWEDEATKIATTTTIILSNQI
jgi:hypothetical protein